jgi:XTP/dITP diphosphohydrolase
MSKLIYIGSMNPKKAREMRELLADLAVEVRPLPPDARPVDEPGHTFAENALAKAVAFARQLNACVVADDSGLEVDALDGRPGVFSARYGGPEVSDEERCRLLLRELDGVPDERRTARFRCAIAFVAPNGGGKELIATDDKVEGRIGHAAVGDGGFGYDPIFVPLGQERTFAQMNATEKHQMSHRGKALRKFRQALEKYLAGKGEI